MIYSTEAVFIHVPKTGGMSVTRFLVNALDCPVTVVAPANARNHSMGLAASPKAAAKLGHVDGRRHETSPEALSLIRTQGWALPGFAFAVIRDPVDLLLSYYKHMRKPHVWRNRGLSRETLKGAPLAAMEHGFHEFCRRELHYGKTDEEMLDYYRPYDFARLDIVPLARITSYLSSRFGHHVAAQDQQLEHRNRSSEKIGKEDVAEETKRLIRDIYPGYNRLYKEVLADKGWQRP